MGSFRLNGVSPLPVASDQQNVDEAPVVLDAGEVVAAAQDQRLLDGCLEVPVLNALFAGHDAGAENWAVIASLIETCKMNGVDPHAWLSATLTDIVQGNKQSQIDHLLPWNYAVTV